MRPRLIALPASLAVALGLAACGGETLTKDEYIKQADAICQDFRDQREALPEPKSITDAADLTDKAKPLVEGQVSALRDLKAPDEIKEQTEAAFDLLDQQVPKLEEFGQAAKAGDEKKVQEVAESASKLSTEANAKAREIGLKVCGNGG